MCWKNYGDDEAQSSLISNFLTGVFIGTVALYDGIAWLFVALGWCEQTTMRLICFALGIIIGILLAWSGKSKE